MEYPLHLFIAKSGKKYMFWPGHIRGLESVGTDSTRVYAYIAGTPIVFTTTQLIDELRDLVVKAKSEESEQST